MKVFLGSIGCRLNQSEMETIGRQLMARGHSIIADHDDADSVLINTCAVTAEAARDARSQTRRIQRRNPQATIYLTGCYATIAASELSALPGTPRVVPNQHKSRLLQILDPHADDSLPLFDQEPILREYLHGHLGNTRAFVKVQDGCNNNCTFCVTTIARGKSLSRRLGEIVAEIQALATAGYQEVVLTGVHLGSYGRDLAVQTSLCDLVRTILEDSDIPRLRLSSLEPWDIEPDFFALWEDPRLQPHLHLPLQSGSDKILRRMARRTSRASFRRLVAAARESIPSLSISTDVILGFPGEDEDDFVRSKAFVQEMAFSRLHAFTYSERPGTAAAKMGNQVPMDVRRERTREIIALGESLSATFHQQFEGSTRAVLWERSTGADSRGLKWSGYTDNYIRVIANGPADLFNRITPATLVTGQADHMWGTIS